MVFEQCIPNAEYASLANQTARYACKHLGISAPVLQFFRPSNQEPVKNGRQKGQPFEDSPYLKGVCTQRLLSGKTDVWIRDGLHCDELVVTVSHELHHCRDHLNDHPTSEAKAELFGQQVLSDLAVQSQLINFSFM